MTRLQKRAKRNLLPAQQAPPARQPKVHLVGDQRESECLHRIASLYSTLAPGASGFGCESGKELGLSDLQDEI